MGENQAQKALQIKKNDKFYGKLLSKESSAANPSFRVYYGGASGAVPFIWESRPGTPKHQSQDDILPPLTPPPSYQLNAGTTDTAKKPSSKHTLLRIILPRFVEKNGRKPSSPSSVFSSPSVSSFASVGSSKLNQRRRFSSSRSSFSSMGGGDDDEFDSGSPRSTVCFGVRQRGFRGCYKMVIVKNALLSIVGHGSRQGTA